MTERLTQPWKTGRLLGLNMNFQGSVGRLHRWLRDRSRLLAEHFRPLPDRHQAAFIFSQVKERLALGPVGEHFVRRTAAARGIRTDVFERIAPCGCKPLAS